MKLREKLCEPFGGLNKTTVSELEKIVKDFTIGFAEWLKLPEYRNDYQNDFCVKELLEIYEKENGL